LYTKDISEKNSTYNFYSNENSSLFDSFVSELKGKFSSYDILRDGQYLDLTKSDWDNNRQVYLEFIKDKNLKFIIIMFNVYSIYTYNYVNVIAGTEMLQFFSYTNSIFTSAEFNKFDEQNVFLLVIYGIFMGIIVLSILKLIYEMNLKVIIFVHSCQLIHELINLSIIIIFAFFMTASKNYPLDGEENVYIHYLPLISVKSYLMIVVSFAVFCWPFKLISFLSWFKGRFKYLIVYLNVLFRMLPGVIILTGTFSLFLISLCMMLYMVYNEYFPEYSSFFATIVNFFNTLQTLKEFYYSPRLNHNLNISYMYLFYNLFVVIAIFTIFFFTISTYNYLFKKASLLEVKKEEDEVVEKLEQINDKIEALAHKEEQSEDNYDFKSRRQIIWLCLTNSNELYNEKNAESYKIILFNSSLQIIAFLKYLFAIKPKMQFENLDKKFAIIIECKSQAGTVTLIRDGDMVQIETLFDWLNFAGCRVPVAVHTQFNLDRNLRMSISSNYWNVQFINTKGEIKEFFEHEKDRDMKNNSNNSYINDTKNKIHSSIKIPSNNLYNIKGPRFTIEKNNENKIIDTVNIPIEENKIQRLSFHEKNTNNLKSSSELKKLFQNPPKNIKVKSANNESIQEENSRENLLSSDSDN
jgi:hypothetical protein